MLSNLHVGDEGQPCTMVIRTPHWTIPHYRVWGLPFHLFYSTRSSQFFHERPDQTILGTLLRYLLYPMMAIVPEDCFTEADKGNIVFKRASSWWFWKDGIEFDDNTKIKADVVILATGYDGKKKLKTILPEPFRSLIEYPTGMMPLYRGTIHPWVAFVGYVESAGNLHTSELRSMWLAGLVDGKLKLPSAENMAEQIWREMEVMRRTSRFYKRHCVSTFSINHSDEICKDMGWKCWRKKSWLSEAFSPYGSQDYCHKN
ncbi:hypothetical protein V6N13_139580 [Hibiscus sabdariffa]|uniref:Flavin-containing monooxygenase n=1 Tax=Hibiscus sabdariffa TaxID=183260 RepID=A0ABR2C806_9ROSI